MAVPILSVAPMLDYTDRHYRFVMRQITRRTVLYSEMVTMHALLHGDADHHLAFGDREHPVVLQLGGDDPDKLARCAEMAERYGYDGVNLNVGCPSDRVQKGRFGACLMAEPGLVARCVKGMREAVSIPVTVKNRIGIDGRESYGDLRAFVESVADGGCEHFVVHARIAVLAGLSPKQNRDIPPLRYEDVYRLKDELPALRIELNGGVRSLAEIDAHLEHVDGVMLGRVAVDDPFLFAAVDARYFGEGGAGPSRREIVEGVRPYARAHQRAGGKPHHVLRHILTLFSGQPGNRRWRRLLGTATATGRGVDETLGEGLALFSPAVLDARSTPAD